MSGDTQQPEEKLWEVREVSGDGWNWRLHGSVRFIYATSRKDAKDQFIKVGYKQFKSTRVTAVPVSDDVSWEEGWAGVHAALAEQEVAS